MTDETRPANGDEPLATATIAGPDGTKREWWFSTPFVLAVGVVPPAVGLYFLGIVAIGLLLTDRTRRADVRAGGAVLVFWWMYMFRQGTTSPYVSALFLAIATVFWFRAAATQRAAGEPTRAAGSAAVAAFTVAAAVGGLVPYGYRAPAVSRDEALRLAVEERTARPWRGIRADVYLVETGNVRFVHKPMRYVVFYEQHATVKRTADNQPCFARREVWRVDAIDGSVHRQTYDDSSVADDPCLPLRVGTEKDVRPVPTT